MTERCGTCGHYPDTRNSSVFECSHADCPHRRKCWSDGTPPASGERAYDPDRRCTYCLQNGHRANNCPTAEQERKRRNR